MNGRTAIDVAVQNATCTDIVTAECEFPDVSMDTSTPTAKYDNNIIKKIEPFIPMSPKEYGQRLQGRIFH